MSEEIKKKILEGVLEDESFKELAKGLSDDEKKKISSAVDEFAELVAVPMIEQFQQLLESSEIQEELKKQLRKTPNDLVKK